MDDLIIVGAGGLGKELIYAIEDANEVTPSWKLVGVLDDDESLAGRSLAGVSILGPITEAARYRDRCRFVLAVASHKNHQLRRKIVERMGVERDAFATIIHPSAQVSRHASLGRGCFIAQNAVVQPDAVLGDHVIVSMLAGVAHDSVLDDYVTLAPGAMVSGFVRIGSDTYVGARAVVRDHRLVGNGSTVGMGAVVTSTVANASTVVGNPARELRPSKPATRVAAG